MHCHCLRSVRRRRSGFQASNLSETKYEEERIEEIVCATVSSHLQDDEKSGEFLRLCHALVEGVESISVAMRFDSIPATMRSDSITRLDTVVAISRGAWKALGLDEIFTPCTYRLPQGQRLSVDNYLLSRGASIQNLIGYPGGQQWYDIYIAPLVANRIKELVVEEERKGETFVHA